MHEIIEIPFFMDSPFWQERILALTDSDELVHYQGFKQLCWQVDDRVEVYFYLIDRLNEHMIHESLGAIIPRAPVVVFCSEDEPAAQGAIMDMFAFYDKHFSTPAVWFTRKRVDEDGASPEKADPVSETGRPVYILEQDTPEYFKHILRLALKEIFDSLLKE